MTDPPATAGGPHRPGPVGGDMAALIWGLARRLRIPALTRRHDNTKVMGLFAGVNGLIAIAIMSAVAWATGQPFIFPSLGPTAFLLFYTPTSPAASPRNTVIGHAIGAAAGYLALVAFGLTADPPALATEVTGGRVGAAAVSLALTSAVMVWARAPHPPAGATTLIVSLGILREPDQLVVLMIAVVLLTGQGFVINRLAGIDYPIWRPRPVS
ncbi:MAG: HPP family protein [Acidimicrobiales bacterium]